MSFKILVVIFCAISFRAHADGENSFDRFLGGLSKGTHYLLGNSCEKANEAEASSSLNRAATAICSKLGRSGALSRQAEDLQKISERVNLKSEDKFFALLSLQHSLEMKCAAGNAEKLSKEDAGGPLMKNLAGKVLMLRDAKIKLGTLAAEASSKGVFGCNTMGAPEKPNPLYAQNNQTDPQFEYCSQLKIAGLSYQMPATAGAPTPSIKR